MRTAGKKYVSFSLLILTGAFFAILSTPLFADKRPADIPEELQNGVWVIHRGDMIYATGMALVENIRPDKALELAQKKSLLRAMQMIHLFAGCPASKMGLQDHDYQQFLRLFAPMAASSRIEGAQIIRQWESDEAAYTAIAVPYAGLSASTCAFSSLEEIIEGYLGSGVASFDGLLFSLKHAPRYSLQNRAISEKIGSRFRKMRLPAIASIYDGIAESQVDAPAIAAIASENRIHRASRLVGKARNLMDQSQWEKALIHLSDALLLAPSHAPALLLAADCLHKLNGEIHLVIAPAKAALRTGTRQQEALVKLVDYLEAASDPEAPLFRHILNQSRQIDEEELHFVWSDFLPAGWLGDLQRFENDPLLSLVVGSLGNAINGVSRPPAEEFRQAAELFDRATRPEDIEEVIGLLMVAGRKQPYAAETYNLLGACFRNLKKYDLALPFLWQALNLKPEYDLALVNLALCSRALDVEKAADHYFSHLAVANSSNGWVKSSYENYLADK